MRAQLPRVTLHLPPDASGVDRMMARDVMAAMRSDLADGVITSPHQVELPDGWKIVVDDEPLPVEDDIGRRARLLWGIGYGIACVVLLFAVLVISSQ